MAGKPTTAGTVVATGAGVFVGAGTAVSAGGGTGVFVGVLVATGCWRQVVVVIVLPSMDT